MNPGTVSFSGGRTSAFMLRSMMDRGLLVPDLHVLFANTGREREETLEFVRDVGRFWRVRVTWLEYQVDAPGFREVSFETASRKGEPFDALITKRNFLPNPVARFCTQELKIRVMREWMKAHGYEHWINYVGIRADEPRRAARLLNPEKQRKERFEVVLPMVEWGTTLADVNEFWSRQPFTLKLKQHEGNCDLCFLKTADKRVAIANERPDLAAWWRAQEQRVFTTKDGERRTAAFRKEGTLAELIEHAQQRAIDIAAQGDLFTCFCGDDAEASQ